MQPIWFCRERFLSSIFSSIAMGVWLPLKPQMFAMAIHPFFSSSCPSSSSSSAAAASSSPSPPELEVLLNPDNNMQQLQLHPYKHHPTVYSVASTRFPSSYVMVLVEFFAARHGNHVWSACAVSWSRRLRVRVSSSCRPKGGSSLKTENLLGSFSEGDHGGSRINFFWTCHALKSVQMFLPLLNCQGCH